MSTRSGRWTTRGGTVVVAIVGALLGLIAAGRPWASGQVEGLTARAIQASGAQAYPGLSALVLVAAAAAVAAAMAGARALRMLSVVIALVAIALVAMVARTLNDPRTVLSPVAAEAGALGSSDGISNATGGLGAYLALVAALVLILAAVGLWRGARRWSGPARRYEAAGTLGPDAAHQGDAARVGAEQPGVAQSGATQHASQRAPHEESSPASGRENADLWAALSEGHDPTEDPDVHPWADRESGPQTSSAKSSKHPARPDDVPSKPKDSPSER